MKPYEGLTNYYLKNLIYKEDEQIDLSYHFKSGSTKT